MCRAHLRARGRAVKYEPPPAGLSTHSIRARAASLSFAERVTHPRLPRSPAPTWETRPTSPPPPAYPRSRAAAALAAPASGCATRCDVASVTLRRDEVDRRQVLADDLLDLGERALPLGQVGGRRLPRISSSMRLSHGVAGARLPGFQTWRAAGSARSPGSAPDRSRSPGSRSRCSRSRRPSKRRKMPRGSSATTSTAMPTWRSCSWIIVATRSRMLAACVRIENRAGLPAASSSMPSPLRSVRPSRQQRLARSRSCGYVGAASEYQRRLPGVTGP